MPNRELMRTVSAVIKEDLSKVKDGLDIFMRGERRTISVLEPLPSILCKTADTLGMLNLPSARELLLQHAGTLQTMVQANMVDENNLVELARALLQVESSLDDLESRQPFRQNPGADGETANTLGRGAEYRQILYVVVKEAKIDISRMKDAIINFIAQPLQHDLLADVPHLMAQVAGSLAMLSEQRAAGLLVSCKKYISEELLERQGSPDQHQLEALADVIVSIEYYLEALEEDRGNRETILDHAQQSMEHAGFIAAVLPVMEASPILEQSVSLAEEQFIPVLHAEIPVETSTASIFEIEKQVTDEGAEICFVTFAASPADVIVPEQIAELGDAVTESDLSWLPDDMAAEEHVASSPVLAGVVIPLVVPVLRPEGIDDEIIEIFIEEAQEEMASIATQLALWKLHPEGSNHLTLVRRSFHTLKGSGRMVGATGIGEFAWSVENMLNRVIDGTVMVSSELLGLVDQARQALPQLIDQFSEGTGITADVQELIGRVSRVSEPEQEPASQAAIQVAPPVPDIAPSVTTAEIIELYKCAEPGKLNEAVELSELDESGETFELTAATWSAELTEYEIADSVEFIFEVTEELAVDPEAFAAIPVLLPEVPGENGFSYLLEAEFTAVDEIPTVTEVLEISVASNFPIELQNAEEQVEIAPAELVIASADVTVAEPFARIEEPVELISEPSLQDMLAAEPGATTVTPPVVLLIQEPVAAPDSALAAMVIPLVAPVLRPEGIDDEIIEIFIEEAQEEMASIATQLTLWKLHPEGSNHLTLVRRSFHTLKGSGRMVGATGIGEFAWSVENMLNRVIDGTVMINAEILNLVDQARQALPQLIGQFSEGTGITADVQELIGRVNRVSEPEQVVVAPAISIVSAEVSLSVTTTQATGLYESAESSSIDKPDDYETIDITKLSDIPEPVEFIELDKLAELSEAAELAEQFVALNEAIELNEFAELREPKESSEFTELTEPVELDEPVEINELIESAHELASPLEFVLETTEELAFSEQLVCFTEPEIVAEVPFFLTGMPSESEVELGYVVETELPAVDVPAATVDESGQGEFSLTDEVHLPAEITVSLPQMVSLIRADQQIEPVLLEIFSKEATGHLAAIQSFVDTCQLYPEDCRITEGLVRTLHTLHGSAGMAGTTDIATVSGRLEEYVKLLNMQHRVINPRIVTVVSDSIELLTEMVAALQQHGSQRPDMTTLIQTLSMLHEAALATDTPVIHAEPYETMQYEPMEEPAASDMAGFVVADKDNEIVEIFLDEAREILDASEITLQQWTAEQGNHKLLEELQRQLHTLKGGARMAGISEIGDLSHNLESVITVVLNGQIALYPQLSQLMQTTQDRLIQMFDCALVSQPIAPATELIALLQDVSEMRSVGELQQYSEQEAATAVMADHIPEGEYCLVETAKTQAPITEDEDHAAPAETEDQRVALRPQHEQIRVRADLLDSLVNFAAEISISRSRIEQQMGAFKYNLVEVNQVIARLRGQLRNLEIETEAQIVFRYAETAAQEKEEFDPLEFDRFSQMQQLSRSLLESVSDLANIEGLLNGLTRESETLLIQQARVNTDLHEGLMRARMVQFAVLMPRLRRIVRQTCQQLDKNVELRVIGADCEMDRMVLDRLVPCLEHMLRNAIDHGIESPEMRRAAGKQEAGTISIKLQREGSAMAIQISDNGYGLNLSAIRAKAIKRGLLSIDDDASDNEIMQFILEPGFTTTQEVTQISGRGVGLDVVNSELKQLNGTLDIASSPGAGTTFIVRLPLTLSINRALLVHVGEDLYAIPLTSIERIVQLTYEDLVHLYVTDAPTYSCDGHDYQLTHLGTVLSGERHAVSGPKRKHPVLLARTGDHRVALEVDALIGSREIVVKSVGPQISTIRGITGATILGDGRVVLILDINTLVRSGAAAKAVKDLQHMLVCALPTPGMITAMVVDDSITVRKVTTRLLERHNIQTISAKDGVDAVALLQDHIPDVVLLDVEMPRMDGYELATYMRNEERLRHIPIIMITSRTGQKHRDRAMAIGVNSYMGKPYQESELLGNISNLLGERLVVQH